jgi:Rrf2 family protein
MVVIHRDTDYALRALVELARSGQTTSVSELSEKVEVPVDFLRKIMQRLKAAEIVHSVQGPSGGYGLARPAGDISLGEVIDAVQGPVVLNACFEDPSVCGNVSRCRVREKLAELEAKLAGWLDELDLGELTGDEPLDA